MNRPELVYHADWSTRPANRWAVRAVLHGSTYVASAPEPVGPTHGLLSGLAQSTAGAAVAGFDFPNGVPIAWARSVGVRAFRPLLPLLGSNEWSDFFRIAESPGEIGPRRPFYPARPGGTEQAHLCHALGVSAMDDLRRRCDLGCPGRRAAASVFWTLGGNQVGRAAISGWRDLLQPALRSEVDVALWPFEGDFSGLLDERAITVVETYPAEFYSQLGLRLGPQGKRKAAGRRPTVAGLQRLAEALEVTLDPRLAAELAAGFEDDDRFDAFVGLMGMINVIRGRRAPGDPPDHDIRSIEGWMLGQQW